MNMQSYCRHDTKWQGDVVTELKDYKNEDTLKLYCYGLSGEKYPLKKR